MPKIEFLSAVLLRDHAPSADVRELVIGPAPGVTLPEPIPGGHIQIRHASGVVREYSLINDPGQADVFRVAIKRYDNGRGGSVAFHRSLEVGEALQVSVPVAGMRIDESSDHHVFIAGGIGVTAIVGLLSTFSGRSGEIHYCVRNSNEAPYLERLEASGLPVRIHESDAGNLLDPRAVLDAIGPGTTVYQCGPPSLMDAVDAAAVDLHSVEVRREAFTPGQRSAVPASAADEPENDVRDETDTPFDVHIKGRALDVRVEAAETMLRALLRAGVPVDYSCEAGECGTCILDYLEGNPIHRDSILEGDERDEMITPCVSRAKGRLIVDL